MKKIFSFTLSILLLLHAKSQSVETSLANYAEKFPVEKVYLHYDKSAYSPGETVWFKAYLMEGLYPAAKTKTLYIDWIGMDGKVLKHSVSPLEGAVTNGQFDVPSDYSSAQIQVRAYTRWMLNFDTAFLYSKSIRIISKDNFNAKAVRPATQTTLSFFPEGGDMIQGVVNRIAFKVNDQWGRPSTIRGVITDNSNHVVDSLRVQHDGMGSFNILPQVGTTYTATWKDEKGVQHTSPLPAAKEAGVSMQVLASGTRRTINLSATSNLPPAYSMLHIVGTTAGKQAFRTDVPLTNGGTARRIIDTKPLPTGILTITIFDNDWRAIAERISFVNNQDYSFEPTFEVEHWGLGKRKRNQVRITIPDSIVATSLSISVTDGDIERDSSENIYSYFLLSSDIRGKVNNPSYYFMNKGENIDKHLDLVMLTNGWRRFKWEDLAQGKLPEITMPRDTSYLALSGQLFGVTRSQLSGNESIVLMVKPRDSASTMIVMPVQTNGTFRDPNIIFFDTLQVYYSLKAKGLGQADARFMTDRLPAPNYQAFSKGFSTQPVPIDTTGFHYHASLAEREAALRAAQTSKVMETVVIKTKQKTPVQVLDEKYASGLFQGDSYQFDLVNNPNSAAYNNIFSYLQGKVAGLQITTSGGETNLSWRGGAPTVYIDQVQSEPEMVSSLPVSDIAYIKVFRPPFMGGFGGANGAIAIYTRRGDDAQNTSSKGLSSNRITGYSSIRQFYSPNYDSFVPGNERPDSRTTLYWNPLVTPSIKNKQVLLTFYNNDLSKSFRVVIEGISQEGLFTHLEQVME